MSERGDVIFPGETKPSDDGVTIARGAPCPRCNAARPDPGDNREMLTCAPPKYHASCAGCGWTGYEWVYAGKGHPGVGVGGRMEAGPFPVLREGQRLISTTPAWDGKGPRPEVIRGEAYGHFDAMVLK